MKIETCDIKGLVEITPDVFNDNRGYFYETYNKNRYDSIHLMNRTEFLNNGDYDIQYVQDFVQDNESYSAKGTIRGLHWQAEPYSQAKLVRVIKGKVWDVAVDIRKNSPTFGKWHGVELSEENKKQFFIPCGFAHGFIALEDSIFSYKCTNIYNKPSERGLRYDDPTIAIEWPKVDCKLSFSEKDLKHPFLNEISV